MMDDVKRTPIFEEHQRLGAKMVPFAGYAMPVQYPMGIVAEHNAVRERAGLFDVSHMGELDVRGPGALDFVQYVTTNDASKLKIGQAQYTVICRQDGGALDDCIVYRFADRYMIVVNASNRERDRDYITAHSERFDVEVNDISDDIALLALQGRMASRILSPLTDTNLEEIGYYHFAEARVAGVPGVISRTGYTGEDGFELYVPAGEGAAVWRKLLHAGADNGIAPIGLGARDSLRLEMGYILYGNDLDDRRTPIEAGLGWVVKLDKGDFLGRDAIVQKKQQGLPEKLAGFALKERGFPRPHYEVRINGEPAGEVTSGTLSPCLNKGIGMSYLPVDATKPGTSIEIMIRDKPVHAEVVRPPFYRDGSVRK
jgi:aminomethyltransferase